MTWEQAEKSITQAIEEKGFSSEKALMLEKEIKSRHKTSDQAFDLSLPQTSLSQKLPVQRFNLIKPTIERSRGANFKAKRGRFRSMQFASIGYLNASVCSKFWVDMEWKGSPNFSLVNVLLELHQFDLNGKEIGVAVLELDSSTLEEQVREYATGHRVMLGQGLTGNSFYYDRNMPSPHFEITSQSDLSTFDLEIESKISFKVKIVTKLSPEIKRLFNRHKMTPLTLGKRENQIFEFLDPRKRTMLVNFLHVDTGIEKHPLHRNSLGDQWTFGDQWCRPKIRRVCLSILTKFGEEMEIVYNDFSNLHGGFFDPHEGHSDGTKVDGYIRYWNDAHRYKKKETIKKVADDLARILLEKDIGEHFKDVWHSFTGSEKKIFDERLKAKLQQSNQKIKVGIAKYAKKHHDHFHFTFNKP